MKCLVESQSKMELIWNRCTSTTLLAKVTMKSIVKKGKVKSTFICLCLLFEEFHVSFGPVSEITLFNLINFL